MKTSFYFVLWIGIYLLIDIFGGRSLQVNSFYIALIAVWAISGILNKATANQQAYMANREGAAFLELVYRNDYKRYLGIFRRKMLFDAATFIYFVITIIFLLMIHESLLIVAIFAFFGYGSAKATLESYRFYSKVKEDGKITIPDDEESIEQYNRYSEMRQTYQADEMCPPPTLKDKLLRGCNFGFSILSILLGILYIVTCVPGLIGHGAVRMGAAMMVAYGGLAFIYGINDLITTSNGYNTNIN